MKPHLGSVVLFWEQSPSHNGFMTAVSGKVLPFLADGLDVMSRIERPQQARKLDALLRCPDGEDL